MQKQFMLLLAMAFSVAIGVTAILWSKSPTMIPLYVEVEQKQASEMIDNLQKNNILYKYEGSTLYVPAEKINEARLKLSASGLNNKGNVGYEIFDKSQGFGSSQFIETVKYKRSIEGELSRTISSLTLVRSARVHIGMPRQNSFLSKNQQATASVMLELVGGATLDQGQVLGIVNLVAASVPGLLKENVSVVDGYGNLLTTGNVKSKLGIVSEELRFTKEKEQELSRKIEQLIAPIVGYGGVKAEVSADFDFSFVEKTTERFDNDKKTVRNEFVTAEHNNKLASGGVPGALSNIAPKAGEVNDKTDINKDGSNKEAAKQEHNIDKINRQYELDRSMIYTKDQLGKIKKLSVAVVLNDKVEVGPKGKEVRTPLGEIMLAKIDKLVKNAVGFDEKRGDTVTVVYSPFVQANYFNKAEVEPKSNSSMQAFLESPLVLSLSKPLMVSLLILAILFAVVKPIVKHLAKIREQVESAAKNSENSENKDPLGLPEPDVNYEKRMEHVNSITKNDSKKAAKVLMDWVGEENG